MRRDQGERVHQFEQYDRHSPPFLRRWLSAGPPWVRDGARSGTMVVWSNTALMGRVLARDCCVVESDLCFRRSLLLLPRPYRHRRRCLSRLGSPAELGVGTRRSRARSWACMRRIAGHGVEEAEASRRLVLDFAAATAAVLS